MPTARASTAGPVPVDDGSWGPPPDTNESISIRSRILLAAGSLGLVTLGLLALEKGSDSAGFFLASGILVCWQALRNWPIATLTDDTRPSRQLVQQIVRKRLHRN